MYQVNLGRQVIDLNDNNDNDDNYGLISAIYLTCLLDRGINRIRNIIMDMVNYLRIQ